MQSEEIQDERTENRRLKQVINKLAYDNEALGNEIDQEKAELNQTADTLATVEVRCQTELFGDKLNQEVCYELCNKRTLSTLAASY